MQLVLEHEATAMPEDGRGLGVLTWKSYIPLITIISLLLVATAVLSLRDSTAGNFSTYQSIGYFMTGFFLVFSGFKLMDLKGFAAGYSTYDLLASRWFPYGYIYPVIELSFGLLMLSGIASVALLLAELIVMTFSGLGVFIKILRREPVHCVCLGTFLKVPLTTVTLIEDFGMAALALILLLHF
jgi:hypothetical protein